MDNGTGDIFAYRDNANSSNSTNRFLPNLRITNSNGVERLDGTIGRLGESFLIGKFPLSYLAWLRDSNLSTAAFDPTPELLSDLAAINQQRIKNSSSGGHSISDLSTWDRLVRRVFGLQWNSADARWDYVGIGGGIQGQIQSDWNSVTLTGPDGNSRSPEPNFFQLLKSGILSGSTGVGYIVSGKTQPALYNSSDYQIFRIGACVIDQFKDDSYPTRIAMLGASGSTWVASGTQRLPYITRWAGFAMRSPDTPTPPETVQYNINFVIVPILSNPFQGSDLSSTNDNALLPLPSLRPDIRIKIEGSVEMQPSWTGPTFGGATIVSIPPTVLELSSSARDGLAFNREVSYISEADCKTSPAATAANALGGLAGRWEVFSSDATWNALRGRPVGFRLLNYYPKINSLPSPNDLPTKSAPNAGATPTLIYGATITDPFQITMEYRAQNGQWYPYSTLTGTEGDIAGWLRRAPLKSGNFAGYEDDHLLPVQFQMGNNNARIVNFSETGFKSDPLTFRTFVSSNNANTGTPSSSRWSKGFWDVPQQNIAIPSGYTFPSMDSTLHAQLDGGFGINESSSIPSALGTYSGQPTPAQFFPAWFSRNNNPNLSTDRSRGSRFTSYLDVDGVRRIADSGKYSNPINPGSPSSGNPFLPSYDPTVSTAAPGNNIDRPVVLNRPVKSIADLGYVYRDLPWKTLDFFSSNSADSALLDIFSLYPQPTITAGLVNINKAPQAVVEALVSESVLREKIDSTLITPTNAQNIAESWIQYQATSPLLSPANLNLFLDRFDSYSNLNFLGRSKIYREAVLRAIIDKVETRSWNLLIDLIAQSGRFTSTDLSPGKFLVESESRNWISNSLDRINGSQRKLTSESINE